ncbi:MAG: crotonase/enoyl-CoA hydratase family protein [Actinomycetes bacterium]
MPGAYPKSGPHPPRIVWTVTDGVADVRLNRPDKLNAVDDAMFAALGRAGDDLAADRSVRAVVISGEGRAFCAGIDLGALSRLTNDAGGRSLGASLVERPETRITNGGQHAVWSWHELEVPVIAAVRGVAFGAGFQLALGADLRFVAPDAQLSVMEIRWGLIPDMTGTHLLPRLVGPDVAKEMTWTGRRVGGEEALRIGLATRCVADPHAEALELARELAAKSPHAIRAAKWLLDRSYDTDAADQFAAEERAIRGLVGSRNQAEAVRAGLEDRVPNFEDA